MPVIELEAKVPNTNTNSSLSALMPNLQIAWDSTSINALCKCPRYYQYNILEGWTFSSDNAHLVFGTVFHLAKETYKRSRASGADHNKALIDALRVALTETWDSRLNRPWTSEEPTKTRKTLLRSIIWYHDLFKDDSLETLILANGKPAVELSFQFPLNLATDDGSFIAPTGEGYMLCGHIDEAVTWDDNTYIIDSKTTKYELDDSYFKQYTPDNQVSVYSVAGQIVWNMEVEGLIIDAAQILVNSSRFRRREIPRSSDMLEEWLTDFKFKLREAEMYAEANYWPQNAKSCGFGRMQCMFRPVCSAEPTMRKTLLEALYIRRTWDPLIPR